MSVSIKWRGMTKGINMLASAPSKMSLLADAVVKNGTEKAMASAKKHAAVDTGFMRDHIETNYPERGTGEVHSPAVYSGFVEYGTRKMSAQPFMRPAVEEVAPKMEKEYREIFGKVFR